MHAHKLTPCHPRSVVLLFHETFDTPASFTTRNAAGPVPFFSDGLSDYFGINKGQGASYFGNRGPAPPSGSFLGNPSEFGGPDLPNAFGSLASVFGSGECSVVLNAIFASQGGSTLACAASASTFATEVQNSVNVAWSAPAPFSGTSLIGEICGVTCAFGRDTLPFNGEAYVGFDGAYLEAEDLDGERWNDPFTLTWAAVNGSCSGTLAFSGKFAMGNYRGIDASDRVIVKASVDGAAAVTILELRGNGDGSNNAFAVDTDGDGRGDGLQLTMNAQTLFAHIPGAMSTSVVLSVTIAVTSANEEIAMDDLKLFCGPAVPPSPSPISPPAPSPSPPPPTATTVIINQNRTQAQLAGGDQSVNVALIVGIAILSVVLVAVVIGAVVRRQYFKKTATIVKAVPVQNATESISSTSATYGIEMKPEDTKV